MDTPVHERFSLGARAPSLSGLQPPAKDIILDSATESATIRLLTDSDRGELLSLSEESGWNQLWPDWERILRLCPEWVFGAEIRGQGLVATSTVLTYGDECGWVGMVLVRKSCRGGGLGKLIFEKALETAKERGIRNIGLDAADLGRPIYLKYGFVDTCPISRWSGTLKSGHGMLSDYAGEADWPGIIELDYRHSGVDRSALLRRLAAEPDVRCWVCRDGGRVVGYGILRPGREAWQLGPVVVDQDEAFSKILSTAAHFLNGRPVFMDIFHPGIEARVKALGLERARLLMRMYHGHVSDHLSGEGICCGAGFELG